MVDIPDDEGDAAMPKRTVSRLLVGLLGVTAFGSILASCSVEPIPPDPPTGPAVARFFLEIVNESSERARVQVVMFTTLLRDSPEAHRLQKRCYRPESNGKMTFKIVQNHSLDDVWDSSYIRWFKEAHFYDEDADSRTGHEGPGDDTLVVHWSADELVSASSRVVRPLRQHQRLDRLGGGTVLRCRARRVRGGRGITSDAASNRSSRTSRTASFDRVLLRPRWGRNDAAAGSLGDAPR